MAAQFHRGGIKREKVYSFRWRAVAGSSVPRQLPPSPMMVFAIGIEHALGVAVQGLNWSPTSAAPALFGPKETAPALGRTEAAGGLVCRGNRTGTIL
jgi:hypothetical protein